jgi:hypothetical protein
VDTDVSEEHPVPIFRVKCVDSGRGLLHKQVTRKVVMRPKKGGNERKLVQANGKTSILMITIVNTLKFIFLKLSIYTNGDELLQKKKYIYIYISLISQISQQ